MWDCSSVPRGGDPEAGRGGGVIRGRLRGRATAPPSLPPSLPPAGWDGRGAGGTGPPVPPACGRPECGCVVRCGWAAGDGLRYTLRGGLGAYRVKGVPARLRRRKLLGYRLLTGGQPAAALQSLSPAGEGIREIPRRSRVIGPARMIPEVNRILRGREGCLLPPCRGEQPPRAKGEVSRSRVRMHRAARSGPDVSSPDRARSCRSRLPPSSPLPPHCRSRRSHGSPAPPGTLRWCRPWLPRPGGSRAR